MDSAVVTMSGLATLCRRFSTVRPAPATPRIAVVGAGPAGFYASQNILKNLPDSQVDIYEALPVPFGLVRYGVAPDHPEVKNCISSFTKVGLHERVEFLGNTALGREVGLAELLENYHAVLCTYGASKDRELGLPGENLQNVISARDLVSVYNGAPGSEETKVNLDTDTVAIIGVGNVALDVARMILAPVEDLRKTDVTDAWLELRAASRVKRVVVIGRRGPLNVSFTIKELREMIKLPGVATNLRAEDFAGVQSELGKLERPRKRLTELLLKSLQAPAKTDAQQAWELRLWRTPGSVLADEAGRVRGLELGDTRDPDLRETLQCGTVVRSVGYISTAEDPDLPFHPDRHLVPNTEGRVSQCPGLYTAGWLGTGPRGVIIDTMNTAFRVAANIVSDLKAQNLTHKPGMAGLQASLENRTSWDDWKLLDEEEIRRGQLKGKLRDKIVSVEEMLEFIMNNRK